MEKIPEFYSNLYHEKEVICYGSGRAYPALPRPKYAIVDVSDNAPRQLFIQLNFYRSWQMFGIGVCQIIRGISKHEVPVYSWQSAGSTPLYWFAAPEDRGGIGDVAVKSQKLSKMSGKTPREVEFEVCCPLI